MKTSRKLPGKKENTTDFKLIILRKTWILCEIVRRGHKTEAPQQTFSCSKSAMRILEKGVKYVQS